MTNSVGISKKICSEMEGFACGAMGSLSFVDKG